MISKIKNALIAAAILITSSATFAQAPSLGSAADFVLFSTDGAVTNTGITILTAANKSTKSGKLICVR